MGVSVIICTYNGAERLSTTIEHIAKQTFPAELKWEVILADNASTDRSLEVALEAWNQNNRAEIPFRVIIESQAGKLYALQHAIEEASYEYLIICDDDNWLAPDYLEIAYKLLNEMPDIGAIGGQGIPVTGGMQLPAWFNDYLSAYAVGQQATTTGFLKPRGVLWGAGLCTRRSVYKEMYKTYPSFLIEHPGANVLSAEDTEYCMRLILKGYRLYYDASLKYQHFISDHKLSIEFRDQNLMRGFDDANEILSKYHAAMRAIIKTKNRPDIWLYLLLTSAVNSILSTSKAKAEKARTTLFFLLEGASRKDPISQKIKTFIKE